MRTTQELELLTRAQHIREIGKLEYEAEHWKARAESCTVGVNVVTVEVFEAMKAELEANGKELEDLRKQVFDLKAARTELVSAELTKLRKQLAEARSR